MKAAKIVSLVAAGALVLAAIVAGCGGHNGQVPPQPGAQAAAFVGADVCQACHRNQHAAWTTTVHSEALGALEGAGQGGNAGCLPCHTVGFGEPTGFVSKDDTPHLANVQCENCHGAGGNHVGNPAQNGMLVPLEADLCGQCHQGFHHPTFEQWSTSAHGHALETIQNNAHGGDSCLECHSAEAILATGQNVVLSLAQTTVLAKNPITCAACHDPHGSPNEGQLREPLAAICLSCHTSGGALPGSTPHHPQREVLLGLGGREVTGDEAVGPSSGHTNAVGARCVACHVFEEHPEDVTRDNPVNTGHTFLPNVPNACEECHPGDTSVALLEGAETEIGNKLDDLARFFDSGDPLYIDASTLTGDDADRYAVAKFNYQLVDADASHGVHNLEYSRRLLDIAETVLGAL